MPVSAVNWFAVVFKLPLLCWSIVLSVTGGSMYAQGHSSDTAMVAQKDLVDVLLKSFKLEQKEKTRTDKKVNFSFIPVAGASAPSGRVAVSSINAAFYLGDPATTNLSNIYLIPYTNFSTQRGIIIRPTIWTTKNLWNFQGEVRKSNNGHNTWGLGTNSSGNIESILEVEQFRFYGTAHRLLLRYFYAGFGYNLDYFYNMQEIPQQEAETDLSNYGIGTQGTSVSSGLTVNLLRDSRKNSINPIGGFYSALAYKYFTPTLGSTTSWSSFSVDLRKYVRLSQQRHSLLAFWTMYWGTFGDVPYLNLPGTAQDLYGRSGRGYKYGRYRGKQMLYAETEYRFDISATGFWGGVVFINGQSYTEMESEKFESIKPATGFGLRVKFNKRSNANITLDFAFGKDSFNWYLNLGEFF
ncbi:MAG: BamA/TamA family outer membrane protein [Cyclobacteriaceae bacterium]|nr:BamA/TamA family outer membrane protein [Cyclobacteriaceae bacterium]